jgi:hypothetical protein
MGLTLFAIHLLLYANWKQLIDKENMALTGIHLRLSIHPNGLLQA